MASSADSRWAALAAKLWPSPTSSRKVKAETVKSEVWDTLDADDFSHASLSDLESLQILENYLWPGFTPEEASNHHVLLLAVFVNVKQRSHLPAWDAFSARPDDFSVLFRRVLSLSIDGSLSTSSKTYLLSFVVGAFQSLENPLLRKECAPLVAIGTWHCLHSERARESRLNTSTGLRKAWRAAEKRYNAGDEATQARIRFERSWLYTMLVDFLRKLNVSTSLESSELAYCEKFMEFLVDLTSQLPTRRYTNAVFKDFNLLPATKLSRRFTDERAVLVRDLHQLLQHFMGFAIEDHAGQQHSARARHEAHFKSLSELQRIAMKYFEGKLKVLALSNYASIDRRSELEPIFTTLSDSELKHLCDLLRLRTNYPQQSGIDANRNLYTETLIATYEKPVDFQETVSRLSLLPTEASLYDPALLRNEVYDGSTPLAIAKLNLQYLSLCDFLWRSFSLQRSEAFYEIRKDLESTVKRMQPRPGQERGSTIFGGFSKMAIPIAKPAIIEVGQPKVGSIRPAFVRAEVILDVGRLNEGIRLEWDSLRPGDVIFLLSVRVEARNGLQTNGHNDHTPAKDFEVAYLRAAEVHQVLDENSRPLRGQQIAETNGLVSRPRQRRLLLNLDAATFKVDSDRAAKGKPHVYQEINVVIRRKGRENNFRPLLQTIQNLISTETQLPSWFQEVFLGYGDPSSCAYTHLAHGPDSIDFRDTFLDWEHLQVSFPASQIRVAPEQTEAIAPPYVIEQSTVSSSDIQPANPRKRRREQMEAGNTPSTIITVSTYKPSNTGPFPADAPKLNTVRYTPAQIEAIKSGAQPGLSIIVGPPGTGKTDVATQIINLLYHNFSKERILLVAHSNQALNQLFQKIMALDIDTRHLLRLGHGEEELESEESYTKAGRVESFLENRTAYLAEVDHLAAAIGAQGAHGSSCETADYFNKVFVQPAWTRYWDLANDVEAISETIIQDLPFHSYFATAPVPSLFPPNGSRDELLDVAKGCERHTTKIFSELESIRPFEILRHGRDRDNHLLINEARIIAMTSTHASIRQSEIAELGFHYDTLIMEEAAQITEIESFIPCAMQKPDPATGELSLKRIVLIGDHFQNSPIVQNMAFRQYANLEQSLFLRLVRLGVPIITLDQQGRCRPSIAGLFKWRYPNLGNLPSITQQPEFVRANAGFRYDYQFINVPDYQGQGEREPTPHFLQNLGEAEYAVALYQYMRLLGYAAKSISILATYAGQKALIRDVLEHRCKGNRLFGLPRMVTTVDKYQGEQNDYVILSLTRTRSVGYLRDVRRLTVALSRARLGLYILGRRELFETCYELKPAMDVLMQRPDQLSVVTGEMFPTTRSVDGEDVASTQIESLEHLGQYVFEMTQAKVKALGGQMALVNGTDMAEDSYGADDEIVDEEDPLHEGVGPD